MKTKGVTAPHPAYERMLPPWQMCIDAAEGEIAVHLAGTKYLPKLKGEKDDAYTARKNRTPFFNATWRTISGLKGMMFRKSPQRNVPAGIELYMLDVDMAGTPLDLFVQHLAEEVLTVGRAGVLVDYPRVETEGMTVAMAAAMGVRPMLQMYKAADIINWKCGRINGVMQLVLVVLREDAVIEGKDEFDHASENRYRVLDLVNGAYRQRVYRSAGGKDEQIGEDIFPQMGGRSMTSIPFVIFGADKLGADVESPPLLDLATMNFKHYTVSADYEHGCHFSGLPTLFVFGLNPDTDNPIYIGGPAANCVPDASGSAVYAQVQGGFEALQHNLESKEHQMAVLGARMLEQQKNAVESAEGQSQRVNGEASMLAALANVLSMGMERCLSIFAQWAGAAGDVIYRINTDYLPVSLGAQELLALVTAWQSGAISQETLYHNLQAGEIIQEGVTFEEEQERIASRAPALLGLGV